MLTLKQYLANAGRCPKCNATDIVGGFIEVNADQTEQRVNCSACGAVWFDIYRLTNCVVVHDDGTEEALA